MHVFLGQVNSQIRINFPTLIGGDFNTFQNTAKAKLITTTFHNSANQKTTSNKMRKQAIDHIGSAGGLFVSIDTGVVILPTDSLVDKFKPNHHLVWVQLKLSQSACLFDIDFDLNGEDGLNSPGEFAGDDYDDYENDGDDDDENYDHSEDYGDV